MGGTCVIRGCVPKKLMVYASAFAEAFEDAAGFGWTVGERSHDWGALIAAKDAEIARLEGIYARNAEAAGVEIHRTRATLRGPNTVHLADHGREVTAKYILVATGGAPFVPDIEGAHHVITSNEVFHLSRRPERIVIVGGGYIACEFACILAGLGTEVHQVFRAGQILRGFDEEVRAHVAGAMAERGIHLHAMEEVAAVEGGPGAFSVRLQSGAAIGTDCVMYATGRIPNTEGLGLEAAGVAMGPRGEVIVDAYSRTNVPSVWAVGDVTDRVALTPVAIREGQAFAEMVFGGEEKKADHELIPTAVFTQPEIGTCGMTEEEATAHADAHGGVEVYSSAFRPMMATLSGRSEKMLMKLIVGKESRRVLGCHVVGHAAGEMIQMAGVAMKMGATKEDFDRTMAVHPTAAEELVTMKTPTR